MQCDQVRDEFLSEFTEDLRAYSAEEVFNWWELTRWLVKNFVYASQLDGPVSLTPDNNIIQDFKHREQPGRNLRRLAYIACCRFVKHWNTRETRLAISPVIIYEHLGRKVGPPLTARTAMGSITHLLSELQIPLHGVEFDSPEELSLQLQRVEQDATMLAGLLRNLDNRSWAHGPEQHAHEFVWRVDEEVVPDVSGLQYFEPWYVKTALRYQIEQRIINQSKAKYGVAPIFPSELSTSVAKLNKICRRRDILTGLGDLDILQTCDLRRQYEQGVGHVMLGQTFDEALANALRLRSGLIESHCVHFGQPDTDQQIARLTEAMIFPFGEETVRMNEVQRQAGAFLDVALDLCRELINEKLLSSEGST
ncbi:hypothetical protein [Pseudoxanthomonas mexicana]